MRRTLSVRLSVRPSRYRCVTSRHLANYNDTHVLFGTHRGPHIVRPSRPHKLVECESTESSGATMYLFAALAHTVYNIHTTYTAASF